MVYVQIGVHHAGRFYEFVPWTGSVTWDITPWGYWKMTGENEKYLVFEKQLWAYLLLVLICFCVFVKFTLILLCSLGGNRSNHQRIRNSSTCPNNRSRLGNGMQGHLLWRSAAPTVGKEVRWEQRKGTIP